MNNLQFITLGSITINAQTILLCRPKNGGLQIITNIIDPDTSQAITYQIEGDDLAKVNEAIATYAIKVF